MHLGYEVTYVRNFTDVDDKVSVELHKHSSYIEQELHTHAQWFTCAGMIS